jgi:hypothetical protein
MLFSITGVSALRFRAFLWLNPERVVSGEVWWAQSLTSRPLITDAE